MADSDISKEAWNDPAKNVVAANRKMSGKSVNAVILVGPDGEPYAAGGGAGGTTDVSALATKVKQDEIIAALNGLSLSGASASVVSISASTTSVLLAVSNSARKEVLIENNSDDVMYVKYGISATTSSYSFTLKKFEVAIVDSYKGVIHAVWGGVTGNCTVSIITS